jgi:hypothetical protein
VLLSLLISLSWLAKSYDLLSSIPVAPMHVTLNTKISFQAPALHATLDSAITFQSRALHVTLSFKFTVQMRPLHLTSIPQSDFNPPTARQHQLHNRIESAHPLHVILSFTV